MSLHVRLKEQQLDYPVTREFYRYIAEAIVCRSDRLGRGRTARAAVGERLADLFETADG